MGKTKKQPANESRPIAPSLTTVFAALISLKLLLFYSYHSTDFEVHRNWLSLTHQLPVHQWYTDTTNAWTLDYPPLFAYCEWLLSWPAVLVDKDMLSVQAEPYLSRATLFYQRATVLLCDVFYAACVYRLATSPALDDPSLSERHRLGRRRVTVVLLLCDAALLLLDSIHFQYNGWLTGWLLLSLANILEGNHLRAAAYYCILVNLKHIYLYYAPAYAAYYLCAFCFHPDRKWFPNVFAKIAWTKCVALAGVILSVFAASFGPFLSQLPAVLSRLFPVQRGLTHAYWAPNAWALYNTADLLLYNLVNRAGWGQPTAPPSYTSGLVQQYGHAVLPDVTPIVSVVCSLVALLPICLAAQRHNFVQTLTLCGLTCFVFGWHVHEKAIILVTIPACLLAATDRKYLAWFCVLSSTAHASLMPLLFTPFELPIKLGVGLLYSALACALLYNQYSIQPHARVLSAPQRVYLTGLVLVVVYAQLLHHVIWGEQRLAFLRLLCVSLYCACGVVYCYVWLYWRTVGCDRWQLHMALYQWSYARLVRRLTTQSQWTSDDTQSWQRDWPTNAGKLQYIAGLDVSTQLYDASQAAVALTLHAYPSMRLVTSLVRQVHIDVPYVPGCLAAREAEPMCQIVEEFMRLHPDKRPQLLLVDGNGLLHPHAFGLACHVGLRLNLPTVGVAKNLHHLPNLGREQVLAATKPLAAAGERVNLTEQATGRVLGAAVRLSARSAAAAFISVGHAISLTTAVQVLLSCSDYKLPEPIRQADAISREAIRKWS